LTAKTKGSPMAAPRRTAWVCAISTYGEQVACSGDSEWVGWTGAKLLQGLAPSLGMGKFAIVESRKESCRRPVGQERRWAVV
jgi:hypothetical protein